jgi:hypothetical protein
MSGLQILILNHRIANPIARIARKSDCTSRNPITISSDAMQHKSNKDWER